MWCNYKQSEVNCNGMCYGCSYNPYSNPNGITYNYFSQLNYECPECHGKFNFPAYKNNGTSILTQLCPFCGRIMEGLNG